ncbi:LacI family transcriptional regulator [Opitutaceae bacterium EW11]|nr:LacI family transcriptional regulator [Opitutaceae bacterium EW11]
MPKPVTIRSLARQLRISVATVSEALRDSPRVSEPTRERVHKAAEKLGYVPNPLLGAALSAVRRSRHQNYRGTLALVDTAEKGRTDLMLFHREIAAGAEERAQTLGFNTELFWVGELPPAVSPARLSSMLFARGIAGVVLLPFNLAQDFSSFDFSRFSAVQMDHCLIKPRLHTVLPDHYVSMLHALERLTERGYERIGLCMERRKDVRLLNKWSSGFLAFWRMYGSNAGIEPLIMPELTREGFLEWFEKNRPDLVVAHRQTTVDWLRSAGVRVPEDVGYAILNYTERTGPCAGLDLQPRRMGAAAVEAVVGMMHRHERGIPECPHTITLEASWVEGPTLRDARAMEAKA